MSTHTPGPSCTCTTKYNMLPPVILFCPLHAAAPEMKAELENDAEYLEIRGFSGKKQPHEMGEFDRIVYRIRKLLAKIERKP